MILFATRNIRLLNFVERLSFFKHFFIAQIDVISQINSDSLLDRVFTATFVTSGTSKQTAKGRFAELDLQTLRWIGAQESPRIHDIAVSSGITSYELFSFLKAQKKNYKGVISDKYSSVFVSDEPIKKVFDAEGTLVFAYVAFLFASPRNRFFPLSKFIFSFLDKEKKENLDSCKEVKLYHPLILDLLKTKEIEEIYYDVFDTQLDSQFSFVRCMNVLNSTYFDSDIAIYTKLPNETTNKLNLLTSAPSPIKDFYKGSFN